MNKLMWLDEQDIANLIEWEVIQIIESRNEGYNFHYKTKYLCLCRRIDK